MAIVRERFERAVIVDHEGYFVAKLRWDASAGFPSGLQKRLRPGRSPEKGKLYALRSQEAFNVPSEKARWDRATKSWIEPTDEFAIINEATGEFKGRERNWEKRLKPLPDGFAYVDHLPPQNKSRKPVYDAETDTWLFNRRVGLVDDKDVIVNIVNENPRSDTENVVVPDGWFRIDDDDWPTVEEDVLDEQGEIISTRLRPVGISDKIPEARPDPLPAGV